jgi:hypothetical protein
MRRFSMVLVGHLVMNNDADADPSFDGTTRHRGPTRACIFAASALNATVIPTHAAVESVTQTTAGTCAVPAEGTTMEITTVRSAWRMTRRRCRCLMSVNDALSRSGIKHTLFFAYHLTRRCVHDE